MNSNLTQSTRTFAEKIVDYLLSKCVTCFGLRRRDGIMIFLFVIEANLGAIVKATTELSTPLLEVLREILHRNGASWMRSPNCHLNDLLARTLDYYQKSKFSKEIRNRIQILLCDIVLDDKKLAKAYGLVFKERMPYSSTHTNHSRHNCL